MDYFDTEGDLKFWVKTLRSEVLTLIHLLQYLRPPSTLRRPPEEALAVLFIVCVCVCVCVAHYSSDGRAGTQ